MAQNHNGSEPLLVCREKRRKGMWGMELWGGSDWFWGERLV